MLKTMTLTQYVKSLNRQCSLLGLEPVRLGMANAYRVGGYSPKEAASFELDEYVQFKRALREETKKEAKEAANAPATVPVEVN